MGGAHGMVTACGHLAALNIDPNTPSPLPRPSPYPTRAYHTHQCHSGCCKGAQGQRYATEGVQRQEMAVVAQSEVHKTLLVQWGSAQGGCLAVRIS